MHNAQEPASGTAALGTERPAVDYAALRRATGDFDDAHRLAAGGFGAVYSVDGGAQLLGLPCGGKQLVAKVRSGSSRSATAVHLHEEHLARGYDQHPNISALLGVCRPPRAPGSRAPAAVLLFERMDGDLAVRDGVDPTHGWVWGDMCAAAADAARGLHHLHTACGAVIVHGDVKPANLLYMRTDSGTVHVRVSDLGVACEQDAEYEARRGHRGTPGYYPCDIQHSPKADIYAYSITFLQLLLREPLQSVLLKRRTVFHSDAVFSAVERRRPLAFFGEAGSAQRAAQRAQARKFVALCWLAVKETNYKCRPGLDQFLACLEGM